MRILVIGGGAIGRMLVRQMKLTRHEVALVARPAVAEAIRNHTSLVHDPYYTQSVWTREVYTTIAVAFAESQRYDLIVIAVKSYDTAKVAKELSPFVTSTTTILTVQNGIGNEDALSVELPGVAIMAGALTTPVETMSPTEIRIMSHHFWIGLAEHTPYALTELTQCAFKKAGFTAKVLPDARSLKWSKLLMNIMGNATSAILGWTPAQIFADSRLGALEMKMLREALTVMRGLEIPVAPIGGKPLPHLAWFVRRAPIWLSRQVVGRFVVRGRNSKMPSLYYDVHPEPRGKSEVGWLNGVVAREAERLRIPAPVNATLTEVIGDILRAPALRDHFSDHPERLLEVVDRHSSALSSPGRS